MCVDHIFPRGLGGDNNLDNLRLLFIYLYDETANSSE